MDVIIPTNLVCVLFDPAIPTSSFNYIVFYTCFYYNNIIDWSTTVLGNDEEGSLQL